jgi:hypothetical protein
MMGEGDRKAQEAEWDGRTPLERLNSLERDERTAFLAFFAGGRSELRGSWSADTGKEHAPLFGKAECEWVSFDLWRLKLPGLRLTQYEEGPRKTALGMTPGSVVWPIYITVTEDGRAAREAYWSKWREDVAANAASGIV